MFKYRALPSLCTERFRISTGVKQQLSTVSDGRGKIVARKSKMRLSFIIGIIASNLINCHAEPQEKSIRLDDVSNEKISPGLQQTLENLGKMTNEQKLNALTELTYSANNFSLKFYENILSSDTKNIVVPVFAIFQTMGSIAWGSTGDAKREIHRALKLPGNKRHIFAGFEEIHRRFKENRGTWFSQNFMPIHKDSLVTSDFKNISERIFSAEIFPETIFASKGTMDILSGSEFRCCTRSQQNLYPLTFTNADGIKIEHNDYVRLTGKYRHGQLPEINATFVEIPCQEYDCSRTNETKVGSTRMFILLPNRMSDLKELEKNIGRLSMNKLITGDLHDVNITVPVKFQDITARIYDDYIGIGLMHVIRNAEIFLTTPPIKIRNFRYYGTFQMDKDVDSITPPGLTNEEIPKVTVDRPFITIITTTDENPLILHMARVTSL